MLKAEGKNCLPREGNSARAVPEKLPNPYSLGPCREVRLYTLMLRWGMQKRQERSASGRICRRGSRKPEGSSTGSGTIQRRIFAVRSAVSSEMLACLGEAACCVRLFQEGGQPSYRKKLSDNDSCCHFIRISNILHHIRKNLQNPCFEEVGFP